jgi:hypothetical protein
MFSYTEILPVVAHFDWFMFSAAVFGGTILALIVSIFIAFILDGDLPRVFAVFAALMFGVGFVSSQIANIQAKVYENVKYTATFERLESVRSGKNGYATKIVYRLENGDFVMMPYRDGQVVNKTTTLYYNK